MSWKTSEVMHEFVKIAYPENPYKEDPDVIKNKRLPNPEKSIVEVAHPDPAYVAEARGDGGLLENQLEQQSKIVEMINKMPTGSLVGRYASALHSIVKFANQCDELGHTEAADLLVVAAKDLTNLIASETFPLGRALK